MDFSATKEACQQSPVTLNQLLDWIYIGTVALSCVAVGARPCFLVLPCLISHIALQLIQVSLEFFSCQNIIKYVVIHESLHVVIMGCSFR